MLYPCDQERIERLRKDAIQPEISFQKYHLAFFRQYAKNTALGDKLLRYADAYAYALHTAPISISPDEMIVGKTEGAFTPAEEQEYEELRPIWEDFTTKGGQNSHMAVDYDLLLEKGIVGILALIEKKRAQTSDPDKLAFYRCCSVCLQAVADLSNRYAFHASQLAEQESDPVRKAELKTLAEICHRVPRTPAKTFHEAVQSVHFLTHCLSFDPYFLYALQFQLGHPDRYLWKFYQNDLQSGRLSKETAQMLLDCLAIQINRRVPHGLSSGYMVGGRDEAGNIVANDLTEM